MNIPERTDFIEDRKARVFGRLARAVTVTAAAFSVGVSLFMRRPDFGWIVISPVITIVAGLLSGWKGPIYVERRLEITIKIAVSAISLFWFVSLFRNKFVLDMYWSMMVAAVGVSYMFRQSPKPEATTS